VKFKKGDIYLDTYFAVNLYIFMVKRKSEDYLCNWLQDGEEIKYQQSATKQDDKYGILITDIFRK
jgi:hypothetical protein